MYHKKHVIIELAVGWLLLLPAAHGFGIPPLRNNDGIKITASKRPSRSIITTRLYQASSGATGSTDKSVIHHVTFEYCTGCWWMARSIWMMQELLTTFNDDPLSAITLVPSRPPPGAHFIVTSSSSAGPTTKLTTLWDRQAQEGFPEMKELKQLVRDQIDPDKFLGHSDNKEVEDARVVSAEIEDSPMAASEDVLQHILPLVPQPHVAIQYCTGCRWMLRSAYFATELLTTFDSEINAVSLIPSRPPEEGGIFRVAVNGQVIWDRAEQGGFPEVKVVKQMVRDILAPSKNLGHSDSAENNNNNEGDDDNDDDDDDDDGLDDDEAEEMRAFYGVM